MGTVSIDNWTGQLEGVADTDYRLVAAGDRVTVPYNQYTGGVFRAPMDTVNQFDDVVGSITPTPDGDPSIVDGDHVRFDGDDGLDYGVDALDAVFATNTDWSIAGWLRPDTDDFQVFACKQLDNTSGISNGWRLNLNSNRVYFMFGYNSNFYQVYTPLVTIAGGIWHPFLATYAGTTTRTMRIYYDDIATYGSGVYPGSAWSGGDRLWLGRRNRTDIPLWYTGDLSDCMVWDSVIDPATDWIRTRQSTGSLRTAASAVDSGTPGAIWQSVNVTIAAPTSDESYAVYLAPSDSITVPDVLDPAWVLIGSGLTASANIDVSGLGLDAGQYGHLRAVPGVSSDAIHQYAIELDALSMEYNAPSTAITEAAPWTIGATATLTVRDVSGEQFASNGRRAQSYLPSIGRLAQEFFASGGRRAQDYSPTKGGRG